eukprot:1158111-Pelagomonas_calceolata.AAC.4
MAFMGSPAQPPLSIHQPAFPSSYNLQPLLQFWAFMTTRSCWEGNQKFLGGHPEVVRRTSRGWSGMERGMATDYWKRKGAKKVRKGKERKRKGHAAVPAYECSLAEVKKGDNHAATKVCCVTSYQRKSVHVCACFAHNEGACTLHAHTYAAISCMLSFCSLLRTKGWQRCDAGRALLQQCCHHTREPQIRLRIGIGL